MMHSSQQPPAAVHHYQVQERQERVPAYHRPTPLPQKWRQDTLTQNEWGARLIPSGWTEHRDGSGCKFYIHKKMKRCAHSYDHMLIEEPTEPEPSKTVTQRSSSSANSQEEEWESSSPKKKSRKARKDMTEVGTEDLPGSDLSLNFAKRKEAQEVNKENESKNPNQFEKEDDEDNNNGDHNEGDEEESSQETWWD